MNWYVLLVAAVAVERVAELVVARRNLAWSRERGGVEFGAGHYPAMVVLHTGLLVGCLAEVFLLRGADGEERDRRRQPGGRLGALR